MNIAVPRPFRFVVGLGLVHALALASVAEAAIHEKTFTLDEFGARIEADASQWSVSWDRAWVEAAPGAPAVPWLVLQVALPSGETIYGVEYDPLSERTIGPDALLEPAGDPYRPGTPIAPDPDAYAGDAWLPTADPSAATVGYTQGYRIVSVRVAPVRYRPGTGELRVADMFQVRLNTGPALDPAPALKRLRAVATPTEVHRSVEERVDWMLPLSGLPAWEAPPYEGESRAFTPSQVPSLEGSPVDLVIVTPEAFVDEFQTLADWRTRTGIRATVRSVEWVIDHYEAEDLAARIRAFFRDAYVHWGTTYAIIGADTEHIPVRHARSVYRDYPQGVDLATDYYFACLDGNWNGDGDHLIGEGESQLGPGDDADLIPDIYVGRMPASTEAEAQLLANKVMWYEGSDPGRFDAQYQRTVSFWAEVLFTRTGDHWNGVTCSDITFDGARLANEVYNQYMPEIFKPHTNMVLEAAQCQVGQDYTPIPENKAAVVADFNLGRHHAVHIGHGFRNIMSVGAADQKLLNGDADAMTNGDRTSILYAINCNSGAVDFDCIGEHFMINKQVNGNGGAVALVAATDLDFPSSSQSHLYDYFDGMLTGTTTRMGPAFYTPTVNNFVPLAAFDNVFRWTTFSLILMGDPAMDAWSDLPSGFDVNLDTNPIVGFGPYAVQVTEQGSFDGVENATVTVYKDGEVYLSALTDANGDVAFDFSPDTAGPFTVGIQKHNYLPLIVDGTAIISSVAPYATVDDVNIGPTSNGDNIPDRGETFTMTYVVGNQGGVDATNASITASTSSPYASFNDPTATIGTIAGGGQTTSDTVEMQIVPALPDSMSHVDVMVDLVISADGYVWNRSHVVRVGNPLLSHVYLQVTETSGNGDDVWEAGETGTVVVGVLNDGEGRLLNGEALLSAVDGTVTVTDGQSDIAPEPGLTTLSNPMSFTVNVTAPVLFDVTYADDFGTLLSTRVDVEAPTAPPSVWSEGGVGLVTVSWEPSESDDRMGYNLYREDQARGGFVKVNDAPIIGSVRANLGLASRSSFRFTVSAIDSSGNEGARSDTISAATAPPATNGFPISIGSTNNRSAPTWVDLDQDGGTKELVFGSDYLYVIRGDGSEYLDGDGVEFTIGIFSTEGHVQGADNVFWGKPAVGDLDGDGDLEIVAGHFQSGKVYCWNADGSLAWGGDSHDLGGFLWSSASLGNIDDDPELEIVIFAGDWTGDFQGSVVAYNHDGTEVIDGDSNPSTTGILWKSPNPQSKYNYSSVALWDLDNDDRDEIIVNERYGADGSVRVLSIEGAAVEQDWQFHPSEGGNQFTSSPALADVDNNGDYEIFTISKKGLYALTDQLTLLYHKPYTQSAVTDFNDFLPSPVIGDLNGDGELDVMHGWANGEVYAYTASTGADLPGWPVQVQIPGQDADKALINGALANLDDDPDPEFVIGTAGGQLFAFDADGSVLGGFPFTYGGAMLGAPAVWDHDQNGSSDIFMMGNTTQAVSLELLGVPALTAENPWPQWRHDPRNSGVYGSGLGTTPIDLGSVTVVSTAPGEVHIRWHAPGNYRQFRIERAGPGETRRPVGTVSQPSPDGLFSFVDTDAPAGRFARYWLVGLSAEGQEQAGPFGVFVLGGLTRTTLHQNAPNPFVPRTSIGYDVGGNLASDEKVAVRLDVFDIQGRLVRELVDEPQAVGTHSVVWDGTDTAGRRLAPGVYLYQLQVGSERVTRKLVMAR